MKTKEEILKENYSEEFDKLRQNRMVMSYFKYGAVKDAAGERDFVKELKMRLAKYEHDGNTEWLVDCANYCMMEFQHPSHPKAHFRATDSKESPGVIYKK